jgi:catechol 2,3-dioxygenase-like lactoylglutathione lyase family enzyme
MFNALVPELAVRDCGKSLRFYRDLLGFAVVYERPEEGFAFLQLGAAQLMLDQIGAGRTFGNIAAATLLGEGLNLQITVTTLDPMLAALAMADISLLLPLELRSYRRGESALLQRQFVVADPDGYLLRFCESPRVVAATPR